MLSHANQNLDAIYQQLFTSFEQLEAELKSNNRKAARTACLASIDLLSTYAEKTGSEGYSTASLPTVFNTLLALYNSNNELPTLFSTLQKDVIDPIWYFHAGLQKADVTDHYSSVAEKFRKESILNKKQKLHVNRNTITNGISKNLSTSYSLLEIMDVFRYIPNEVMVHILAHLTNHDLARMTKVCQRYHHPLSLFRSTLNIRRAFKEVTEGGNIELVKKMTDNNSAILLMRINYTDYKGQEYLGVTLLQAALRAYNAAMKNMLKGQVEEHYGKGEQEKQVREEVSKWIMDQPAFDFASIAAAITNSSDADICARLEKKENGTPLCIAFNTFWEGFRKCIIESPNFTPAHLLKGLDVYINQEPNWSDHQCRLFVIQVFGFVQRYCPAVVLQDFAQGVYYLVVENEARLGSFKWAHDEGSIIDLSSFCSTSGLGHDNYAAGDGGAVVGGVWVGLWFALQKLFQTMSSEFADELMLHYRPAQDAGIPKLT